MKFVYIFFVLVFVAIAVYHLNTRTANSAVSKNDTVANIMLHNADTVRADPAKKVISNDSISADGINTKNISADSIVGFAETLIGTPYLYASTDPQKGFDCSGFITYVFNHYKINVPRSSVDFTNAGTEISLDDSKKGDIILFTGTDSTEKFVGHMGIIVANQNGTVQFIHSSSGKVNGVTVTPLNDYYKGRFVKVVRLSPL